MARILIVDDTADVREMLANLLTYGGHEVETAENGLEATDRSREHPPDLLICDLMMPGKGGLDTMEELRKENPDLKIICISGSFKEAPETSSTLVKFWTDKVGASRLIAKPFEIEEIEKAVAELLA